MDKNTALADMGRKAAENEALRMCTELYNRVDEKTLDVTKIELVLRNMFGAACQWKEAVAEKEFENRKSYEDGLKDMLDAAIDNHDESFCTFMEKAESAKDELINNFAKHS